jgi:hypothetical protein
MPRLSGRLLRTRKNGCCWASPDCESSEAERWLAWARSRQAVNSVGVDRSISRLALIGPHSEARAPDATGKGKDCYMLHAWSCDTRAVLGTKRRIGHPIACLSTRVLPGITCRQAGHGQAPPRSGLNGPKVCCHDGQQTPRPAITPVARGAPGGDQVSPLLVVAGRPQGLPPVATKSPPRWCGPGPHH